jgi:quercetin dioxygenase-like cupin family protein
MKEFPDFMKNKSNQVPISEQNTGDVEGYYYEGNDGSQTAFWTAYSDRISKKHTHQFDEYMVCISGQYTAYIEDEKYVLNPGDELFIPKGKEQWGECKAGTRTIHFFGGQRIVRRT